MLAGNPKLPKPPDARIVKINKSLSPSQEEEPRDHVSLTKAVITKPDEYAEGMGPSLKKFYEVSKVVAREEGKRVGGAGAGSAAVANTRNRQRWSVRACQGCKQRSETTKIEIEAIAVRMRARLSKTDIVEAKSITR